MRHVIIGGGIAGVCCVEELCRLAPSDEVVLISSSTVLKVRKACPLGYMTYSNAQYGVQYS
jgi:NADPH-dependent 2,4-dienoyl-CoA reductase/sulfur reductase-like enzyme